MATMTMLLQRQCNMRRTHALCVMSCALRSRPCICSGFSTLNTAQNESLSELSTSSNWKYWKSLKIFLCLHLLLLPDRLHDLPPAIDQLLISCEIYMIYMCVCAHILSCFCISDCWQYSLIASRAIARIPTKLESSCCGLWWRHLWRRASRCVRAND